MKRYFEFVEGSSAKFWEISTERQGRHRPLRADRHQRPDANLKTLADADAATKHAEKLIKEKTGKGYSEKPAS